MLAAMPTVAARLRFIVLAGFASSAIVAGFSENGREYGTKLVPKGDREYPWAVWSALESGHGFLMDAL